MQSYYEINVALYGHHLFATAPRSIVTEDKFQKMLKLFKEKFPESDGYQISATYWNCAGKTLSV